MTTTDHLLERIEQRSVELLALLDSILSGSRPAGVWHTIVSHVEEMQRDIREAKVQLLAEDSGPCPGCRKPVAECAGTHVGCKRPRP